VQKYGASKIYTVEDPIFENCVNTPLLKALSKVMDKADPYIFGFASTEGIKDILGALAANRDAAVLSDVSVFKLSDSGIKATRPVIAAKILSANEASGDAILVSVRSGSYDLNEDPAEAEVVTIDFNMDDSEVKATLREIIGASGDKVDLSEAETNLAAGRGAKDETGQGPTNAQASVL